WFEGGPGILLVLGTDERLRSALTGRGWRYTRSAYELLRSVGPDWIIPPPRWDEGVVVRDFGAEDGPVVHRLIYVDAGWADVPGHHHRTLGEWTDIFLTDATVPEHQVLAWRGDRLVGAAMG